MAPRTTLVLSVALLFSAGAIGSDTFCRKVSPSSDAAAYAPRDDGRYCDGTLFEPQRSDRELPVIGVVAAPVRGDPAHGQVAVSVLTPPSGVAVAWPLHLQAVAKSPRASYRLDAALAQGKPLTISSESAMTKVKPNTLRAEELAWCAWSDSAEFGRTYVPVIAAGAAPGKEIEILVRPTMSTAYVNYTILSDSGSELTRKASLPGPKELASVVAITIPSGEPSVVRVKVLAKGSTGDNQVAVIRIIRPNR